MRLLWVYLAVTAIIILLPETTYSQDTTSKSPPLANSVIDQTNGLPNERLWRSKRGGVFGKLIDKGKEELERLKEKAKKEGKRVENRLKEVRDNFQTDQAEITAEKTMLKLQEQQHAQAEAERTGKEQEQAEQRRKEVEEAAQKAALSTPTPRGSVAATAPHIDRPSAETGTPLFGIALVAFPSVISLIAFIVLGTVLYRRRHKRTVKSNLRGMPIKVVRPGSSECEERLPFHIEESEDAASDRGASTSYAMPTNLECRSVPDSALVISWNDSIGEGHFASVYKAIYRSSRQKVVVKVLHLDKRYNEEYRSDMMREIMLMYNISGHRHIVRILAHTSVFDTPAPVLEYCEGGDLRTYLRRKLKGQSELAASVRLNENGARRRLGVDCTPTMADLLSFCWQICDGMVYLSSKGFVHRDLAARNILLDEHLMVKIADFGLCRYLNQDYYSANRDKEVPIRCSAPEALKRAHFTFESDVWSFGVLLYEVFSAGATPYANMQTKEGLIEYLEGGNRLPQPKFCRDDTYELMLHCWQSEPTRRPTFAELRTEFTKQLERLSHGLVAERADEQ